MSQSQEQFFTHDFEIGRGRNTKTPGYARCAIHSQLDAVPRRLAVVRWDDKLGGWYLARHPSGVGADPHRMRSLWLKLSRSVAYFLPKAPVEREGRVAVISGNRPFSVDSVIGLLPPHGPPGGEPDTELGLRLNRVTLELLAKVLGEDSALELASKCSMLVPRVLTMHFGEGQDGLVPVRCTSIAGNEIATCIASTKKSAGALRTELARAVGLRDFQLQLVLTSGRLFPAHLDWKSLAQAMGSLGEPKPRGKGMPVAEVVGLRTWLKAHLLEGQYVAMHKLCDEQGVEDLEDLLVVADELDFEAYVGTTSMSHMNAALEALRHANATGLAALWELKFACRSPSFGEIKTLPSYEEIACSSPVKGACRTPSTLAPQMATALHG